MKKCLPGLPSLESKLKKHLEKGRFNHSLRVKKEAVKLAEFWGEDIEKAAAAGLLHDCGRYIEGSDIIKESRKFGIKITELDRFEPKILHAPLSAVIAKKVFGVRDKNILSAIASHTLGRKNMSQLDKIVYLADHIEPGRRFNDVKKIRRLAYKDLDSAVLESLGSMIKALVKKGVPISEQTVRTRNYYVLGPVPIESGRLPKVRKPSRSDRDSFAGFRCGNKK